jgi:hypothetical protein
LAVIGYRKSGKTDVTLAISGPANAIVMVQLSTIASGAIANQGPSTYSLSPYRAATHNRCDDENGPAADPGTASRRRKDDVRQDS